jgi:hypothetical protein
MTELTAASGRPKASRVHTYGPPSCGNAEPSSTINNAYGSRKKIPRNTRQVNPCAPLAATAPTVSSVTTVQIR